jgi:hypothetical protein
VDRLIISNKKQYNSSLFCYPLVVINNNRFGEMDGNLNKYTKVITLINNDNDARKTQYLFHERFVRQSFTRTATNIIFFLILGSFGIAYF